MAQLFNPREFSIYMKKTQYQLKKFFRSAWPIKWSIFRQPSTLAGVIRQSPYPIRVVFGIGAVGMLVSLIFLMFGTYAAATKEVGQEGGQVREAVFGEMNNFLPVIDLNTDAEKKVSSLLFLPLYDVEYGNLLTNPGQQDIKPVLLSKTPDWITPDAATQKPYNRLRFTLRENLKWSDGTALTLKDVEYTFNLLKSPSANSQFSKTFASVTFENINANQFDLTTTEPSPSLLYSANFSPISRNYFTNLPLERLLTDPRRATPTVTSGYFTMKLQDVPNPDSPQTTTVNPIRDPSTQAIRTVILTKNAQSNVEFSPLIQTYVIKKYDSISTQGDPNSLASDANAGKIDLFTRNLATNIDTTNTPNASKKALSLNQTILPNNTFVTAFTNVGRTSSGQFRFLVNQSLRRYIMCYLTKFDPGSQYAQFLSPIPNDKKIVPVQLNVKAAAECPTDLSTVLDDNYQIEYGDSRTIKRVYLVKNGRRISDIRIDLVWGVNSAGLKDQFQTFFLNEIGIPISSIIEGTSVSDTLSTGEYDLVIYPTTLANPDPYSVYGASGLNWNRLSTNNKQSMLDANPEALLKRYSSSNRNDTEAREALGKFFASEYVSLHLWQGKTEIDLNPRVGVAAESLPSQVTFVSDIYRKLPNWYVQTKREWNWYENPRK